jgi:CRISPR system Cascade subunit CasC
MKKLLEIHILQNFAPSNLNRSDTGSPKDAYFGGHRRLRISSQCLKRAMRDYVRDNNLLSSENMAQRTKRVTQALALRLQQKGHSIELAETKATEALKGLKLKTKEGNKTEYILFLGDQEIQRIANLVDEYWDSLTVSIPTKSDEKEASKKKTNAKQESKNALPKELNKALKDALDGGKAVDLALFGRMLADFPSGSREAACQVAHALSTDRIQREFDFYTAVDDLKPSDTQGADMMGTLEFGSACFYRYAALDLALFSENLQHDHELVLDGLRAFLTAMVKAKPSGKQNSTAAQNDPEYVVFTVRSDADPRSLTNAFEKPVSASREHSLTEAAINAFEKRWQKLDTAYGQTGHTVVMNLTDAQSELGNSCARLEDLIDQTVVQAAALLEA